MDNIFNNNSNGQQANITGNQGNVEINFCPKQIIDFKISYPENLIPRRDMLDKLSNEFESHKCVLISGIGGSGKTSLAYFYAKEKQFKNVAWVTVNGKIEDAYLERMAWDLFEGENLERFIHSTNQQAKLHKVTSILSSINGKSLLVLDINTNNEEIKLEIENKLHNYLPAGDWKTLVLTRTLPKNKSRFVTIEMDKMAENDAKILFSNNYDGYVELNDEQLAIIVKELYYHPLLVEQTAIVLSDGDEDTAEEVINNIKGNNKIKNDRTKAIIKGLAAEGKNEEEQSIYTYLLNLCNIENLSPEEVFFLAVYVTWPTEPIDKDIIDTLLPGTESTLKTLIKKGIISRNGNLFVIHSLIADVLREQIDIITFDFVPYFNNIKYLFDNDEKSFVIHKYSKCIASSFINYGICEDVVLFIGFLRLLYALRDPILSKMPEPEYSNVLKALEGKADPPQLAELYSAEAGVEMYMNKTSNAKHNLKKALQIMDSLEDNEENLNLKGGFLNNLAILENYLDELNSAKKHYQEALEIKRKLSETPINLNGLAKSINNLAILEKKLEDFESAKNHYEEALQILRKLPETPDNLRCLTDILIGIAILKERNLGDLKSAQKHYQEALEISSYLPEAPAKLFNIANIYFGLGTIAVKLDNFDSAKTLWEEALKIARHINNEEYICWLESFISQLVKVPDLLKTILISPSQLIRKY